MCNKAKAVALLAILVTNDIYRWTFIANTDNLSIFYDEEATNV